METFQNTSEKLTKKEKRSYRRHYIETESDVLNKSEKCEYTRKANPFLKLLGWLPDNRRQKTDD